MTHEPGTWSLGACTNKLSDRPYEVLVQGKEYRCNRRHMSQVTEPLIQSDVPLEDDKWDTGYVYNALECAQNPEAKQALGADPVDNDTPATTALGLLGLMHTRTRFNIKSLKRYCLLFELCKSCFMFVFDGG